MGMGFENCKVGFEKKMKWEMGLILPPPSGPSIIVRYLKLKMFAPTLISTKLVFTK